MVQVFITGMRGRVLEYSVTDGVTEWSTFMLRETYVGSNKDESQRRRRGERWNR